MPDQYTLKGPAEKIYLNDPFFVIGDHIIRRALVADNYYSDNFVMAVESSDSSKVRCAGHNDVWTIEE